jgi:hypothetical protein
LLFRPSMPFHFFRSYMKRFFFFLFRCFFFVDRFDHNLAGFDLDCFRFGYMVILKTDLRVLKFAVYRSLITFLLSQSEFFLNSPLNFFFGRYWELSLGNKHLVVFLILLKRARCIKPVSSAFQNFATRKGTYFSRWRSIGDSRPVKLSFKFRISYDHFVDH